MASGRLLRTFTISSAPVHALIHKTYRAAVALSCGKPLLCPSAAATYRSEPIRISAIRTRRRIGLTNDIPHPGHANGFSPPNTFSHSIGSLLKGGTHYADFACVADCYQFDVRAELNTYLEIVTPGERFGAFTTGKAASRNCLWCFSLRDRNLSNDPTSCSGRYLDDCGLDG